MHSQPARSDMPIEWYYEKMSKRPGPFTGKQLRQEALAGQLDPDTRVLRPPAKRIG